MTLGDYLKRAGERRWAWGSHDCATFAADWVALKIDIDPLGPWRGTYSTDVEAEEIIADAGGLANLWTLALINTLCPEVETPRAGDVGVCNVIGQHGLEENGGICTGERWAFLAPRGIVCAPVTSDFIVKAWRV